MTEAEFDEFLIAISDCFLQRDFEAWEARLILPFTLVTQSGPVVLTTRDELRQNFDMYLKAMDIRNMDMVDRTPVSIQNCDDGTVIGTYRTSLLSHGTRVTDPYTSSILLHPTESGWKASSILNALGHHHWTARDPNSTGDNT